MDAFPLIVLGGIAVVVGLLVLLAKLYPGSGADLLDWAPPGRVWFEVDDAPGQPSRWITLRALRVLRWWEA